MPFEPSTSLTSGIAVISVVLSLVSFGVAFHFSRPVQAAPSLAWLFLAALPFTYLRQYFFPESAFFQALGILIVTVALVGGDIVAVLRAPRVSKSDKAKGIDSVRNRRNISGGKVLWMLLIFYVAFLPLVHVGLVGDAPILHIFRGENARLLGSLREEFSKLLAVPYFLKIMFHWIVTVAGPLLFTLLFFNKRYLSAGLVFLWCGIYAVLSLAKLPLILLSTLCVFGMLARCGGQCERRVFTIVTSLLMAWTFFGVVRGEAIVAWHKTTASVAAPATIDQRLGMTPSDVARLDTPPPSTFGTHLDKLLYRTVLAPMEVANRWYSYFPEVAGQWRSKLDLLPLRKPENWKHSANKVATWAYVERFPQRYLESAHAYAALDADAFSYGGLTTVLVAAALLLLVRLAFIFFHTGEPLSHATYFCALGLFAALPFQASIQAMLVPQGVGILLFVQLVSFGLQKKVARTRYAKPKDADKAPCFES